ncbi:MAG: enoyl-CoA hydratase/isomerase family protein [Planctomycetota bacterium]
MPIQRITTKSVFQLLIDRPTRRNAIDSETANELAEQLRQANADPNCAVVVIAGVGPCFCAGSDLKELAGQQPSRLAEVERVKAALARTIQDIDVPVIAAVHGYALGGGCSLATACDLVVSDAQTFWHMPEVLNGWLPPWGIQPLIDRCGPVRARHLLWARERINGAAAHELGLVDRLSEPGRVLEVALQQANDWAALPAIARRSVKPYLRTTRGFSPRDADAYASDQFEAHCASAAAQNTLKRFGAKS